MRSPLSIFPRVLVAALFVVVLSVAGAAAQGTMNGEFYGVDEAEGASLRIRASSDTVEGRLTDPAGLAQSFAVARRDGGAEGVLEIRGAPTLLRLDVQPFGIFLSLIPVGTDGTARVEEAELYSFVRRDLDLPEQPEGFVPPLQETGRRMAAHSFVVSYAFWPPAGVRDGYVALAPRHRTMIALFPAVQLDIIWKLCLAPQSERALGLALRGQGVSCDDVRPTIGLSQERGTFDDFKAEVEAQARELRVAVRCADGFAEAKETCDEAAVAVSRQAVSLETASTVLSRYR
ncbi:MAG: hypothetical protein AAF698_00735 [Pseudomonadota bacterium]